MSLVESNIRERIRRWTLEIVDGFFLLGIGLFVGWVALTQSAFLVAPTAAVSTAALLMPRVKAEHETWAEQWRRPFASIGTALTALFWLLSTVQPKGEILPTDPTQVAMVMFGWMLATTVLIASPFLVVFRSARHSSRLESRKGMIADYTTGVIASAIAHGLGLLVFRASKDLIGPIEASGLSFPLIFISIPVLGLLFVFDQRSRQTAKSTGQG